MKTRNDRLWVSWFVVMFGFVFMVLMLFAPPVVANPPAIAVVESKAIPAFPQNITFFLQAESSAAPITSVSLLYGADRADGMTIVDTKVTPGQQVHVRYVLDTRVFYLPVGIELSYQWIIRDEEGNLLESEPQPLIYEDDRFDWRERSERGVTVYWYQGNEQFGDQLIQTATTALDRLEREIGATVHDPVKIYVYANTRDMRAALRSNEVEWVGGEARPALGLIIGAVAPGDRDEIGRLIPHELSHQVLHQATNNPYGGLPIWFNEGLAVHNQETIEESFGLYLQLAARNGELIPLEALSASFPTDPAQAILSYAQSYSVVSYLIETYGRDAMEKLVQAFAQATPLDQALQESIGLTVDQLDEAWRKTLPDAVPVAPQAPRREQTAPADRFSDPPVVAAPQPGGPPSSGSGGVSLPPSGVPPLHPPSSSTPTQQTGGFVLPMWVTIGLTLGGCTVLITMFGISLFIVLRLLGKGKQTH